MWWLLIGPFAMIPYLAGRRVLRISVPAEGLTAPKVRFAMRETHRGDAELVAARLRMSGGR